MPLDAACQMPREVPRDVSRRRGSASQSAGRQCKREHQRQRPSGRQDRDEGYSLVEAVITLPVMIALTMFVVQYALLWHGRNVAEAAAQDALRTARSYQATATMGQQAALSYLSQVAPKLLTSPHVQVDRTATTVTVRVRAHVSSILGMVSLSVEESASGPVEVFVAPSGGAG
jgi:Flp pilus assembly protein TadG